MNSLEERGVCCTGEPAILHATGELCVKGKA
jgi:hypothetical protein